MAHGAPPDVGLADGLDFERAHHTCVDPGLLEPILERDAVHHGGQHAHVIGRGAVHPTSAPLEAAKDVATADDDADLTSTRVDFGQLLADRFQGLRLDALSSGSNGQHFSRELE